MNDSAFARAAPADRAQLRLDEPPSAGAADPRLITAPPPRRRFGRRRMIQALLGLVIITGVAVFGWRWLADRWAHVYVDDARIGARLVTVSSAVSDVVIDVPITAGDRVEPDQLLIGIDASRTQAELNQIDAMLAGVDAQAAQIEAQKEWVRRQLASKAAIAQAQLAAAQADEAASNAALANAKADFDRVTVLHQRGIATQTAFDEAQATYLQAQQQALRAEAGVRTAEANVAGAEADEAQLAVLDRQIAALDSQRAAYQAERAQTLVDLQQREIRAAFPGVIDATFIHAGEFATPGQRLFIYHDPRTVWIDANVKETEIRNVALGAPATVTVDAYPGQVFRGEVIEVGSAAVSQFALLPSPNPSGNFTKITQRLPIKIAVDQVGDLLRPGMMVEASIDAGR